MDDGTSTFCGYARHAYQNALTNRRIEHITINPDTSYEVNGLIRDKIMECPGKFQVLSINAYFHLLMKTEEVVIRFPSQEFSFSISQKGQDPFLVDGKVDPNSGELRVFNAESLFFHFPGGVLTRNLTIN